MNDHVVLGVDIGGTNTVYGLVTRDGNVIHHESIPTNGSLPIADLLNRLNSKVNEALSSYPEIEKIIGVGIFKSMFLCLLPKCIDERTFV